MFNNILIKHFRPKRELKGFLSAFAACQVGSMVCVVLTRTIPTFTYRFPSSCVLHFVLVERLVFAWSAAYSRIVRSSYALMNNQV